MKSFHLIFVLTGFLLITSCSKDNESRGVCIEVEYNTEIELRIDDEVCFPDENSFIVTGIEHAFCPCDAVCIWQGELLIKLETTSNALSTEKIYGSETYVHFEEIFETKKVMKFEYGYDGDFPECAEDFEVEKTILKLTISNI